MDDKSQVIFANLRNEPRITEQETIEEAVCVIEYHAVWIIAILTGQVFTRLWALHGTPVLRLQNNLTTMSARNRKNKPFKTERKLTNRSHS
jgi:hypothetical protein